MKTVSSVSIPFLLNFLAVKNILLSFSLKILSMDRRVRVLSKIKKKFHNTPFKTAECKNGVYEQILHHASWGKSFDAPR